MPETDRTGNADRDKFGILHYTHGLGQRPDTIEADRESILLLVQQDILLYETAKLRFDHHLHEVETTTGHTICTD